MFLQIQKVADRINELLHLVWLQQDRFRNFEYKGAEAAQELKHQIPAHADVHSCSGHTCHELFKSPLAVISMNKQHLFDRILLEAHFIKLGKKAQELGSLKLKSNKC